MEGGVGCWNVGTYLFFDVASERERERSERFERRRRGERREEKRDELERECEVRRFDVTRYFFPTCYYL